MPINRRLFLQSTLMLGAGAYAARRLGAAENSQRASVTDFGADPTGKEDSTEGVRKAIASLSKKNARIVFPAGKYLFEASSDASMQFSNFEGIEVYANNAELQFGGKATVFAFAACTNVALHDMKLGWSGEATVDHGPAPDTRCLAFDQCETILLEGISVLSTPGVAIGLRDSRDVHLDSVSVAPAKDARASLSSGSHAVMIGNCHGDVKIQESRFEGMGGDGIRVHQSYWRIRERLDERSVVIEKKEKGPIEKYELPQAGGFVQFSSPETLLLLGEIAIESVSSNAQGATLKFSETLSPIILSGMMVCSVFDGPKVVIDHCKIGNNTGSGVILHARSEVTNSHFHDCGRSAILLAPDMQRMEGPVVQTVTIRGNHFSGCNGGADGGSNAETRGVITVDTVQDRVHAETPAYSVNSGIKIQSNIFEQAAGEQSAGAAIYAAGVDGMLIEGNTFGSKKNADAKAALTPAVIFRNVTDADVTGNTASNPQSIVLVQCTDSVKTDGNRLLTAEKTA